MPSSTTTTQSHARSHALLLLQKLLNLRDSASPLTLVLDTLEQSGKPVLREFMSRAQISKAKIIYISFATPRRPAGVDVFVRGRGKTAESLRAEITSHYPAGHTHKTLLILDELNPLVSSIPADLALFLSSLITGPAVSLVGLYHTDVPLSLPLPSISSSSSSSPSPSPSSFSSPPSSSSYSPYTPHPLTILTHLATAVLRTSNLHHAVERRRAQNRSQREPEFGLDEGKEGVLVGLGLRGGKVAQSTLAQSMNGSSGITGNNTSSSSMVGGLVLEMELRRRSGRAVAETFVLVPSLSHPNTKNTKNAKADAQQRMVSSSEIPPTSISKLYLLSDHPAFLDPEAEAAQGAGDGAGGGGGESEEQQPESTFNLGLTEKQRRDREGIVLPYFDAQTDIGAGEGGRILYEMGREDDFDEEEDEI
ncbi:Elongator complex protein 5 [Xylaria sp. FL0933]|nr:Elongator complex protein 5 [Xylaria sp. FL0933]